MRTRKRFTEAAKYSFDNMKTKNQIFIIIKIKKIKYIVKSGTT